MTQPSQAASARNITCSLGVGAALFALGCLMHLASLRVLLPASPVATESAWILPLAQTALDSLLVVALVQVSFALGWRETRFFWSVVSFFTLAVWQAYWLVPFIIRFNVSLTLMWRVVGPWGLAAALFIWLVTNRQRLAAFWRPVHALLTQRGFATLLAAVVVPLRVGLLPYSFPLETLSLPSNARVQHVSVPAAYAGLTNPFEAPEFSVVLEQIGSNPEAVRAVVRQAVANRTEQRAAELLARLPCTIRESTDPETANDIADKLRAAGAHCSVRDAVELFVEDIAADQKTPIGKLSQVLDDRFLTTGKDWIAELRDAVTKSGREHVDRELARRAYIAFKTAEGRALYQTNCRPCHGTKGSGDGPMAAGFSLRPANLRDPQGIATLKPGEALWRIEEGGPALPRAATPWDSSMPAWKHELDRELIWKIILGEYDTANAEPAAGHDHLGMQPVASNVATNRRRLPEWSWLEWPVPAKPSADGMREPTFLVQGEYLYYWRCMPCHGVSGRGDGPAASTMWPRPRDFTTEGFEIETLQPKFKFRTTKQGWLPTDEDLYRTISRGLTGTAMEGWGDVLSPGQIWQLIATLKTFSPAWNDPEHFVRNPNDPVVVKEYTETDKSSPIFDFRALQPPALTPELLREGEQAFLRVQCWQCHGIEARGDGPALGQHYDDWGYRTWPQNLASAPNFKAGHSMKEIYRTFITSLDGNVMPQFPPQVLDPKDHKHGEHLQWALAAYIHSLVQSPRPEEQAKLVLAPRLKDGIPLDPLNPRWDKIAGVVVPLSGQVLAAPRWQAPSVNQVAVKATYDTDSLAVWLRWDDRRPNVTHEDVPDDLEPIDPNPLGPKLYAVPALKKKAPVVFNARDQIELQWPASFHAQSQRPFFFYGDEQNPVIVWRWLADRQGLTVKKQTIRIGVSLAERLECAPSDAGDGAASGQAVVEFEAGGARGVSGKDAQTSKSVRSQAHWANGAWTVVFSRPLVSTNSADLQFADQSTASGIARQPPRGIIPVAVHVWDGLAGETGMRMALSSWFYLAFVQPRPAWHHGAAAAVMLAALIAESAAARWYRRRLVALSPVPEPQ